MISDLLIFSVTKAHKRITGIPRFLKSIYLLQEWGNKHSTMTRKFYYRHAVDLPNSQTLYLSTLMKIKLQKFSEICVVTASDRVFFSCEVMHVNSSLKWRLYTGTLRSILYRDQQSARKETSAYLHYCK